MQWLVLGGVVLSAISVVTGMKLEGFLRARGWTKAADEIHVVHELVHVAVGVADDLSHGRPPLQALLEAEKSPEAQDLLHLVLKKVRAS